ncbi:MAG: sigma-54-dependent transcriptional regulator [Flavobacteriales bacterium]
MQQHYKIFIVEDDPWYLKVLKHHLSLNPDFEIFTFADADTCIKQLHLNPDLVCIDFVLPDLNGDQLLKRIKAFNQDIPVIVISGQDEIKIAIALLKSGAEDYLVKDDHTKDLLWNKVHQLRQQKKLKTEVAQLREELGEKFKFQNILIGQSEAMKKVFKLIQKATETNINVLISGETGTGKELAAKAVHHNSERRRAPFIAVNMAAIPADLVESELYGYEKGAFTGANFRKKGKFEEAENGTLFLDEIGELSLPLQSKLLRAIQEREITRVGGNEIVKLNFRLITATHQNLAQQVDRGLFREDLYYRIMGIPIQMPPLRERQHDIILLAKAFVKSFVTENKLLPLRISTDAQQKLLNYHFPGNVRELKAVMELACVYAEKEQIEAYHIELNPAFDVKQKIILQEKTLREYTADIINQYMELYDYNVLKVAEKLDIGKSTIYNLIKSGEVFHKK